MFYRRFGTKYNNKRTIYNGNYYDSKLEAGYAQYLDSLKSAGLVTSWLGQVVKHLVVNGKEVCSYRLDFEVYYTDGRCEYVETKGFWTPEARIKVKLFEALFGISVKVVKILPRF